MKTDFHFYEIHILLPSGDANMLCIFTLTKANFYSILAILY